MIVEEFYFVLDLPDGKVTRHMLRGEDANTVHESATRTFGCDAQFLELELAKKGAKRVKSVKGGTVWRVRFKRAAQFAVPMQDAIYLPIAVHSDPEYEPCRVCCVHSDS